MVKGIGQLLANSADWLVRRPGYMFLTADAERLSAQQPGRFARAWVELLVVSLGWGLATIGIWAAAWKLFGEPMGRLMPSAMVAATFVLWPYRRAVAGALEALFPSDTTARALAGAAFVVVLTLGLLSLKRDFRHDPFLPSVIAWIRPWDKIYRPMILMPLWGCWAMLITPQFCRPRPQTDAVVAAFAAGCGPLWVAVVMGVLLGLTITYFNFLSWLQLAIPVATVIAAILGGIVFCRLTGGLTRQGLLAVNVLTQLVFLLACLATCNLLVW